MRNQLKKRGALPTVSTGQGTQSAYDSPPARRSWDYVPRRKGVTADDDNSALATSLLLSARPGENAPHELSRLGIKRVVAQTGLHLTDFEVSSLLKGLDVDGNNTVPLSLLQSAVLQRPPDPSALGASRRSTSARGAGSQGQGGVSMAHRAPLERRSGRPHNADGSLASPIQMRGQGRDQGDSLRLAAQSGAFGRAGVLLADSMEGGGQHAASPPPGKSHSARGLGKTQPYAHSARRTQQWHPPKQASVGSRMVTTKQLAEAGVVTHHEMGQSGYHNLKPRDALREVQRRITLQLAEHGAVVDAASGGVMGQEEVTGALKKVQQRIASHIGSNDPYALATSHLRASSGGGAKPSQMRKPATQTDWEAEQEPDAEAAVARVGRMPVDAASTQAYVGAVPTVDADDVVGLLQGTFGPAQGTMGRSGRTQASFTGTASFGNASRSRNPHKNAGGYVTRTTALRRAMGSGSTARPSTAGGRMQAGGGGTGGRGPAVMLDFDAFVGYTRRALGLRLTPANLRSIFDLFDTDGRGRVDMLQVVRSAGLFVSDDPSGEVQGGHLSPQQQAKARMIAQQMQEQEASRQARYGGGRGGSSPVVASSQQLYGDPRGTGAPAARGTAAARSEAAAERLLQTLDRANAVACGHAGGGGGPAYEYRSSLGRGKDGWLTGRRPMSAAALSRGAADRDAPPLESDAAVQEVREALAEHVEATQEGKGDAQIWEDKAWPQPPQASPVQPADVRRAVEGALGDTARSDRHTGTALLQHVQETRPTAGMSSRVLTGEAAARSSARAPTTENEALHRAALAEVAPTVAALAKDGAMRSIGTTPATPPRSYRRGASSYAPTTDERAIARAEAVDAQERAAARAQELRDAEDLETLLEERERTKQRLVDADRAADDAMKAAARGSTLRSIRSGDEAADWGETPLANTGLRRDGVHLFDRIRSPYLGALPRGPAAMPELNHRLPTPPERSDTARSTQALAFVFETGADAEQQPGKDVNGYGPRPTRTHHDGISSSGPAGTRRRTRQLQQALDNGGRPVGQPERQYAYITVYNAVGKPVRKKVYLPDAGTVVSRDFGRSVGGGDGGGMGSSAHLGSTFGVGSVSSLASTALGSSARRSGRRVRLPGESGTLQLQQQQRW